MGVERRLDPQGPAVDLLGRIALHVQEVGAQVVQEERVVRLRPGRRMHDRRLGPGPGHLIGGGHAVAGQQVEHELAAALGQLGVGPG